MKTVENINKRPMALEDLKDIAVLGEASFSSDENHLVYVKTEVDWEENAHRDFIILIDSVTAEEQKRWEGSAPRWSPVTNEVAYLSPYKGQPYIWVYSLAHDSFRALAAVYESHYFMGHLSLKNYAWSPNGQQIAYVSANAGRPGEIQPDNVLVIDRLLYKTKGGRGRPGTADSCLSHIRIVPSEGGQSQLITDTVYNEHSICWSPEGNRIAFVSNRSPDPDNNQLYDLWSIDLLTLETSRHTENFGTVNQPAWCPDGNKIAFIATRGLVATNDSPAEDTQLYAVTLSDNSIVCLTRRFDRRVEQICWHPSGETVYFTAGNYGTTAIYRVSLTDMEVEHVEGEDCQILGYSLSSSGNQIAYTSTDPIRLTEIFVRGLNKRGNRQLTNNSHLLISKCSLQQTEPFWFTTFDGKSIQGWLMKPANFETDQQYPLVLVIHGGPHNMFGYAFEDRMQVLSSYGYGVLFINPRGSSGYGQDFSNGTLLNWGGGDYKDLMAGLDAAIEQNKWIDRDRLGVTGQSYGGFMTNWIITQTSRFKAAVADGSISNLVSFAGTSLYHSLIESEFGGNIYDNFSLLWEWSPLRNVKNVTTPTLFLHGALDNEVPVSQAEEMYVALKKSGVDTRLVQYIEEGHGWRPDLKPRNRHDVLSRTLDWFNKHLAHN